MTESSPVSHVQPEEGAVLGGCGHPVPNTIAKIIDIGKNLVFVINNYVDN